MSGVHDRIPSPQLGRPVHMWRFGWYGKPVLVFPSAAGFAHEWKSQGMVDVLAPLIGGGRIKLYCPESNVAAAWTRKDEHPALKIRHHLAYERFVMDTLVPQIRNDCRSPDMRIAVTGCSLGGLYAALFALKYPETFDFALCMSGRYWSPTFLDGFQNQDVYFNNPLAFAPNLHGAELERIRRNTFLTMVCGQGKWEEGCIEETQALCDVFESKGIPHQRDIWGRDVKHDWEWWKRQALFHFSQRY